MYTPTQTRTHKHSHTHTHTHGCTHANIYIYIYIYMIQIDCCYSNFSKHLPLYNMPKLWNIWSKQIKQNVTRTCFKRIVKNKILPCYNNSVQCKNPRCTECDKS